MTTDADGWIEHDGKGMPVDKGTRVQVRYRLGDEDGPNWAEYWAWYECGGGTITHYRIVDGPKTAATEPVMTLRDQFAMHAPLHPIEWPTAQMAAEFAGMPEPREGDVAAFAKFAATIQAKLAYVYADAMMAERSKK